MAFSQGQTDRLADLYNNKYRDEPWVELALRPRAASTTRYDDVARLVEMEGGRLLELGCGSGQLAASLASQFDELVGIDVSDVRIDRGRRALSGLGPRLSGKITLMMGRVDEPLPFPDDSFDVVLACEVIEFVPNVFRTIDEMARVVRPGGAAIVTVQNACYLKHAVGALMGRTTVTSSPSRDVSYWREHGWDGGALRYFSRGMLADLLVHAGFRPEEWTGSGRLAKYRRFYANFCGDITVRARREG